MSNDTNEMERIARMILFVIDYHEENWRPRSSSFALLRRGVESCKDSTRHERELVYLLLASCWNDAQNWAKTVL